MFIPDNPVQSKNEDRLKRSKFANTLADAILNYNYTNSLVVGLYGKWGSGKTSLINLTLESLDIIKQSAEAKPVIFKFNPWYYSNQKELIERFLNDFSKSLQINDKSKGKKLKSIGDKVGMLSKIIKPVKYIPIPLVKEIAEVVSDITESSSDTLKKLSEQYDKDVDSIKKEISDELIKQKKKILIIIDDIDRLTKEEILEIFKLVKSICDFPNTIYVLAFDHEIVSESLQMAQCGNGQEYLKKIVQISFQIPYITSGTLSEIFENELSEILSKYKIHNWNQVAWGNLYLKCLKYFINSIRDIKVLINHFLFPFSIVHKEVNPIDFIALTFIQVFEKKLYDEIKENKEFLTGVFSESRFAMKTGWSKEDGEAIEIKYQNILSLVDIKRRQHADNLLKYLFPKFKDTHHGELWLFTWRKECRLCSTDKFDTYFKLNIHENELSEEEVRDVLSSVNDLGKFDSNVRKIIESKKGSLFLDRMIDFMDNDIQIDSIQNVIEVIMKYSDDFPDIELKAFSMRTTDITIIGLFYNLLKRIKDKEYRFKIIEKAFNNCSKSVFRPLVYLTSLYSEHALKGLEKMPLSEDERTIEQSHLPILEKLLMKKIYSQKKRGYLIKNPKFKYILGHLKNFENEESIKKYVRSITKSDKNLFEFINKYLYYQTSYGSDDDIGEKSLRIDLKSMEMFSNIYDIANRLKRMNKRNLDKRKTHIVNLYLETFEKIRNKEIVF